MVKPSFEGTTLVERLVAEAVRGTLAPLSPAPLLALNKGKQPKLVVLDVLAWVELGKSHYGIAGAYPGAAEALKAIRMAKHAGRIIVPVTAMNLGEVVSRQDPASKRRLAQFIIELSGNVSLMNEIALAAAEFEVGIRRVFLKQDVQTDLRRSLVRNGIDWAFLGQGVPLPLPSRKELERLGSTLSPEAAASIMERVIRDPSMSMEFLAGMRPQDLRAHEETTARSLEAIRRRHHGRPERAIVRHEVEGLLRDQLYGSVLHRIGIDFQAVVEWLTDEKAAQLVQECPSLDVMMTLLLAANRNLAFPIRANDYRDYTLLRAGIAYADIVVTEKKWAAVANDTGLATRCKTSVLSLKDIRALPDLVAAPRCS